MERRKATNSGVQDDCEKMIGPDRDLERAQQVVIK
jgi:hypothetical protein